MPSTTVFFDGSCPLCAREISIYRNCRGGDQIVWVDVSKLPGKEVVAGLSKNEALTRFHIRTPDGQIVSGGQAFAHLWTKLPAFKVLGMLCQLKLMSWIIDLSYEKFLRFRPLLQRAMRRRKCKYVN